MVGSFRPIDPNWSSAQVTRKIFSLFKDITRAHKQTKQMPASMDKGTVWGPIQSNNASLPPFFCIDDFRKTLHATFQTQGNSKETCSHIHGWVLQAYRSKLVVSVSHSENIQLVQRHHEDTQTNKTDASKHGQRNHMGSNSIQRCQSTALFLHRWLSQDFARNFSNSRKQ